MSWVGHYNPEVHPFQHKTTTRLPCHGYSQGKVPHRHQQSYVGLRSSGKSGGIRSRGTRCQRKRGTMRADHCTPQGRTDVICQLPWCAGGRQRTPALRHGQQCSRTLKKAIHKFRGCHNSLYDPPSTRENGDQDDHIPEVQIQV